MMRNFLTILISFGFLNVHLTTSAQEENVERVILITPSDCILLTQHVPDADVEYKPDVDVRGKKLVPADIENTNNLMIGENGYSFYMTHDALKDKAGLNEAQEGKIVLGQVTVKDGDVLWNGTSLKDADRDRVYMLCNEQPQEKRRPIVKR